jgi:hypothetical protein
MLAVTTVTEADEAAPASAPADSTYTPQRKQPDPEQVKQALKFTKADWVLAGFGILLATAVSVIGLMSSYKALEYKAALPAAQGGWAWSEPWMLPVGLDLSILAFSIVNLVLIRVDRPARWVKWVPRLGAAGTVYLNWVSAGALASQIGHAVLAVWWVVFSEIAAHVYAAQIDAIHQRPRMEGVRFSRWLLDPISTAVIARQMKLWEITRYTEALERHKALKVYQQGLTQRHGRLWRWKAPTEELLPVRLARLGLTVTEALDVPEKEAATAALREHEAGVRARALALRLEAEQATAALAEVERQAGIEAAKARAEAAKLQAEAELVRAKEEARTAAEAVVRKAELQMRIKEAEAEAEAEKLRATAAAETARIRTEAAKAEEAERLQVEARRVKAQVTAEAEAKRAAAEADAEAARIRRREERERLEWEAEQARLRAVQEEAERQSVARRRELEAEQAEIDKQRAQAEREAAEARRRAAEDLRTASVAEREASVAQAEKDRREAEARAAKATAEAQAAEQERAMAVALEAASVAVASARRSPAEREAYIVAEMIENFGEEKVTLRYIEGKLGLPHSTAQDRRNRARQILAERAAQAA